jgi:hypothetical protein
MDGTSYVLKLPKLQKRPGYTPGLSEYILV